MTPGKLSAGLICSHNEPAAVSEVINGVSRAWA